MMFSAFTGLTELANSLSLDNLQPSETDTSRKGSILDNTQSALYSAKIQELEQDALKFRTERDSYETEVARLRLEKRSLTSERDSALLQLTKLKSDLDGETGSIRIPQATYEKIKDRTVQLMERYEATKKEYDNSQEVTAKGIREIYDCLKDRNITAPTSVIDISTLFHLKNDISRAFGSMESELSVNREKCISTIRDLNDELCQHKESIRSLETQLSVTQDESELHKMKGLESERKCNERETEISQILMEKAELALSIQTMKESLLVNTSAVSLTPSLSSIDLISTTSSSISMTQLTQVLERERRERIKVEIKLREAEALYSHNPSDLAAHEKSYLKQCFMTILTRQDSGGNMQQVIRVICRILGCSAQEEAEMLIKFADTQNREKNTFQWF